MLQHNLKFMFYNQLFRFLSQNLVTAESDKPNDCANNDQNPGGIQVEQGKLAVQIVLLKSWPGANPEQEKSENPEDNIKAVNFIDFSLPLSKKIPKHGVLYAKADFRTMSSPSIVGWSPTSASSTSCLENGF